MTHSPLTRRSPLPNPRPSPSPAACPPAPLIIHRPPSTTPLKSSPTTHHPHPHPHPPPPPTLASSLFIHPSFSRCPRPAPLPTACSTKTTFHWSNYLTPTFINPLDTTQHRAHHSTTTLRPPLTTHTHTHTHFHPFPPFLPSSNVHLPNLTPSRAHDIRHQSPPLARSRPRFLSPLSELVSRSIVTQSLALPLPLAASSAFFRLHCTCRSTPP